MDVIFWIHWIDGTTVHKLGFLVNAGDTAGTDSQTGAENSLFTLRPML
jgi:hypothetical protein